ncbi:MAG: phage terminase large subunit [Actinomycetota bacterium]|nr:phage terminase large subunit [Actinomycetota bacterium]
MSATEITYRALEVHKPFHRSAARYKCMVGGVGSGKSYALCAEAIAFALEQPGSDMMIARRHAPALKDSTEAIFFQVLPHELREAGAIQRAGGHVNSYEFPNGSLLKFRGVDDWTKHKALATDQPVLTPTGWRPIGDLVVGDLVVGGCGRPVRVRAVFPQGERQMYRVQLTDGGSVEADAEHLWAVNRQGARNTRRVVRTADLQTGTSRDRLPPLPPVQYLADSSPPIAPYVLGLLLGDGGLTQRQLSYTCHHEDAPELVGALRGYLGSGAVSSYASRYGYGLPKSRSPKLYTDLAAAGLLPTSSHTKFVPEEYLRARADDRLAVLQGLMDTDGSAGPTANRYATVSPHLRDAVLDLARGLGMGARCRHQDNEYGGAWVVSVTPPVDVELFRLERKRARTFRHKRCGGGRTVKAVTPTRVADSVCIEVDDPAHLFVVKDHIVTHNSQNLSWIGFDEADEQSEANLDGMSTRLRQETPLQAAAERGYETTLPMRRQVCLASNPAGKNWLWRRFINAETRDQRGEGFISTTLDNPFLPVDFIEDQLSKPAAFVRRYVLCLFDELAGAIYPEWCDDHRVAWAPPKQGGHMDIWQSFDPGTTQVNPSSCQWAVVDREHQRLVVIAEYEGHDSAAAIHAKRWREIEKGLPGKVTWRTADPAAIGARDRGSNMTLMDIYRRLGFSFDPARSNRHEVRVPALGELIALGRFGVTADCPISFGQIQGYSWEDQLPKDLDLGAYRDKVKKGKDGMVDCAQYLAQRWIWRASTMPEEKDERTPEELFSAHVHATISRTLKPQRGNLAPGVIVA